MIAPDPVAALAGGITVVTPNNRIARTLVARHDAAMTRAGKRAWSAARALPWSTWVATLWQEALEAGVAPADLRVISEAEARFLWERIVREDPVFHDTLMSASGPARLAAEAWQLVAAWGSGGESWRAWRDQRDDAGAFARWAERFHRELATRSAIEAARLPEQVRALAAQVPAWRGRVVALAGFVETTPQQARLHEALRAAGMHVDALSVGESFGNVMRATAATPRDELKAALLWARERADAAPEAAVGIAVEDLALRAAEVRALAEDVLCPLLSQPGHADRARPYTIAVGAPLAGHPMIAAALRFIDLAHGPLPRADAAALVRSPFWPGAWTERAHLEQAWIEHGRSHVSWGELAASLAHSSAVQLRAAIDGFVRAAQSPAAWAAQWRALLAACGWPARGDAQSEGYQARHAWERLLDDFARLGNVQARVAASDAPAMLREMARSTAFTPQPPPAAIAVMDLRDAAGLTFDALWVVGLSAQKWPRPPQTHPLLPLAWQRERGVPQSSPERELAHATLVTQRLALAAPHVVMSAPEAIEDYESAPSALLDTRWPRLASIAAATDSARRQWQARALETIRDDRAPAFTRTDAPGGASTIASQSVCPFQALARRRLAVEPWPGGYEALSYAERGQLVHATMAAFWNDVRTHAALAALGPAELQARIGKAAALARDTLRPKERWQALPAVVAAAEVERIAQIAWQWIERFDRNRAPFAVQSVEEKAKVELAGLAFHLRVDRVDALADGTVAIVDYKTGPVDAPKRWFEERPRSPQLGLYTLALRPHHEVSAVAYAQLKAGNIKVSGIASDPETWRALDAADRLGGWPALVGWWERKLPELAAEFRDGVASVTPLNPPVCCNKCNLHALCRIGAVGDAEEGSP